ncbi:hypothetical protein QJQ45_026526 [Haematococcus lacustris]|nr:hypothetical protein QJQ45_026526 [Haematococcus lacustris]
MASADGQMTRIALQIPIALNLQDLTVVTDIAVPRANTPLNYLVPLNLSDSGTLSITYTNVTLRLPSSCISLAQYAAALCRSSVNSNTTINRWGVGYRTWATAVVIARNLNLTCGQPLPPSFNLMCTNVAVTEPEQLLAALVATGGMAVGTTSYIHILSNISLQAVAYEPWAGALATPRWCSDRGQLVIVTNMVVIADHAARNPTFPDETGLVSPMRPPSQSPSSPASSAPSTPQPVDSLSPDDPILIDQEPAPSSIRRGHKTAMTEAKQKDLQAKYPWCRFSGGCNEKGTPQAHCSTCLEHKPNSSLFAKASGGGGAVTCEAELAQHAKSKAHSEAIGMAQRAGGGAGSIKAAVKAATTTVVQGTYRRMVLAALFMVLWGHSAMSFAAHLQFATHSGAPAMPHDFSATRYFNAALYSISQTLLTQQLAAVRASPYFSLLADSSTDVGTEDHLLLYVRYLEPSSFIYHTSFLCAVKVVGATSEHITAVILRVIDTLSLDVGKLVAFCSDGASTFMGAHNGVIAKLQQQHVSYMVGVHCVAHRTALVVGDAFRVSPLMQQLDSAFKGVHSLFAKSPKWQGRWEAFAKPLGVTLLKFPIFNRTRWYSRAQCVTQVILQNLTLVNLPVGGPEALPMSLFTALGFMVQFKRLPQLTDHLERGAWLMARGVDGYSDEVIEMYLRTHYGLTVQSIAQLNQPSDWSADNLGHLAGQYGTHTFLCKKPGHSMAMKCMNGTWNLLDSMKTIPTPLSHIPAATKRTMHQLFIITPNTRSREQIRRCEEKGIHHIISHVEQTGDHDSNPIASAPAYTPTHHPTHMYMEGQYEECCLVHALNMAMGKKYIDYHAVIDHCKQLKEHLQHLAQKAREEGYAIRTLTTDHIYSEKGKFSTDTLNHYLYRKHHEVRTYLHPATTYLPTHSITPETITSTIASTGATNTDAVLLLSHHHATVIKHTQHGWYQLDSLNRGPKPLSTPNDWRRLQGNLLTICTGNVKHTRFIRREIWIADPLEATTTSALAAHFQDHTDPIDLTKDNTTARETTAPLHVTTNNAENNYTLNNKRIPTKDTTPLREEPAPARQRQDTPEVTLRPPIPQGQPRINRSTTPLDNTTRPSTKRSRATKAHCKDTHTQTLMSQYLPKPTTGIHTTETNPIIDETPLTTPESDPRMSQHHRPPTGLPQATLNRQHITLTTFNVRGLHRSRNEVLNLVHKQSPDILILTETMTQPKSNNSSSGWLKRVMPNYTVHRHEGHSEVLIGIRHDLAIQMQATMMPPCTDANVNTRCVILNLRQRQSEELTLVATYWPSGNNDDAIPLRKKMQEHIRTATGQLPGSLILAGDINATMKAEDRSEHTEYPQDHMMREFATEMRLSEADSGDRAWTYQQPHCNSRIDAILTRDARHGPGHRTHVDTQAYLSDHRPLTATLTTTRLGIELAATHKPLKHSHTILTTPITNNDREAYRLAVQQPSSGAPQLHAHLTAYLAPMYTDAIHFLTTLDKANPQQPQRLTLVAGLPARAAVDTAATMLTTLLETCRGTAMQTCNTKTLTRGGQHYQRRSMCKIRLALGKKLKTTRELSRKARRLYKQNGVHPSVDDLLPETDTTNAEVREAVQARQGDGTTENHVQAALAQLTNSYRDQIHKLDDDDSALAIAQARLRMQHLISTQPKKANKYILRPSRTDHKGLQALADPDTKNICTAPADLNRIITTAYRQKLTPPTPKTGHYTSTQTRNYPWTRPKADDPFTLHTCQNVHWQHTAIMDKAGFQECISKLSGGKAPGPDGIENEIIKMLPWEMRDTIHQLFIVMDTTQQLQMLVMALEDAKLAKVDIYALLVDFTSAFNTTCQDKLLWIMHDLGFPTDATDAVRDLYTGATTRFNTPYGHTDPVPVDRGTIQGDSLSPFLFLIYIEPLLRWLQVGARGYKLTSDTTDSAGRFTIGSIDYADDIAILCNSISNLRCQADKLSAYSDWGHLIISHSKTIATAALHKAHQSGRCSTTAEAEKQARRELQVVKLQGKPVTYLQPTAPFTYLGKMLKERFHNKVKQKHYIALNRLTTMATQDRCPTTTEAKDIAAKRDTTSDLPAAQRLIKPWAAGLTELAPTDVEEDTKHRYADIRAYVIAKKPTSGTQPPNPTHVTATQPPAAQEAIKSNSRLLRRENKEAQSPPTKPTRPKAGTKRNTEGRQIQTIPKDIVRIVGLDLPGLSSWKVDKACRCKPKNLGCILGAMYGHQEAITNIEGWQWDGINKENYYKVHWKPTVIDRWALPLCAEEGYTPTHIEPISREEAKDVCTCELCWLPRGDSPMCHNCKRAYHPACLEEALLSGHKEPSHWLCPICKFGSNEFKTNMRQSAHSDLIRVHWRPTLEPAPLITAHLDYLARRSDYEEENKRIQEARYARPDTQLPTHTRQGLPDPHTWLPRCTNLHSKATFHTYPINPQTDIVGTGRCETFLQLHPHMTTPAMNSSTGEPIMPKHDLVQHVTVHDESGRTAGLLTKQQHQHLHAWLQHTPHARNLATELVALLRRQDTQSSRHPMRLAQDKALTTLHTTRSFTSTVQRWADPLTVRPETTTYWSPDINDTAFGAHHNCLLVRHTGLSTWNVPADDAVALKCVNHAIHSAHQEEAMATIMLIPGKKGISYPKYIDTLRRYPEYCQHLASIPLTNTNCSKLGKHATLLVYVIWNEAGQLLTTKGNPQGWMASTATALHPDRETHPFHHKPNNQKQPATLPSGHKQHLRLPLDRALPTPGHTRNQHQLTHHSTTLPRMAITEWTTVAYTDGSCIKTSEPAPARVGAGVYIPENNALITIALNDPENNTINKAELTAIHAAIKAGARRIATDSLCSLYQIRRALANPMSLINHRHNDILTDIATLIVASPDTIQFFKVKAHSGVIGNEGADALAKHAALHPEQANTLGYHPTTRRERGIWLSNGTDGETLAPLPDCRHSVRAHMHSRHKLGLANQDSVYYQMTQDITKAAAKGAGERVMTDTNISIPAQRTALLYRTGGLYNQKLAMRWKKATDDRCPLCGEADSATHLLSGCSATLPLVQERHNGAGRLIAKAISKGTLGGCIRFADTGSWEKGAKDNLDLPNDTLHTTLRALGLKTATTKNTTRPDILMVTPLQKTGKRGKAIKRVTIIEIKYCADSRWAEQLDKALNQHTKLAHTIRKEGHTVEIRPILLGLLGLFSRILPGWGLFTADVTRLTTLSTSLLVHELSPARATLKWTDVQLVSVVTQLPSAPILVQETGLMRLNGLGTSPFQLRLFLQTLTSLSILRLAPDPQLAWRVAQLTSSVRAALPEVMTCTDLLLGTRHCVNAPTASKHDSALLEPFPMSRHCEVVTCCAALCYVTPRLQTLHQRTVIIGHSAWPQALLLDLAGAPSCLAQQGPDAQLTLSSLVLANAAPLLSSLVCGSAARQAGILCTPPAGPAAARNLSSPDASSRAVWQAVGLPPLDSVSPLLPLCTPALADALGGFTSLLWFFASSRTHPTEQPPLARAPLVLLNVTLLLPDLEMRAIGELAQGGSTRVNLRPDTLDLLQAQLADQQVSTASRARASVRVGERSNTLIVDHYKTVFLSVWSSYRMACSWPIHGIHMVMVAYHLQHCLTR